MNVNINVNWQIPTIKKVLTSGKVGYERSNLSLTVSADDNQCQWLFHALEMQKVFCA